MMYSDLNSETITNSVKTPVMTGRTVMIRWTHVYRRMHFIP